MFVILKHTNLVKYLGLKVGLHYGDYRSKLAPFEAQKNIFYTLKKAIA
jgi:hypothetical protein